ncbi:MAG TPA: hypothetical protein VHE54_13695, partial [Puia sp.]|nr:hypothetical protein [Puia sp.]
MRQLLYLLIGFGSLHCAAQPAMPSSRASRFPSSRHAAQPATVAAAVEQTYCNPINLDYGYTP